MPAGAPVDTQAGCTGFNCRAPSPLAFAPHKHAFRGSAPCNSDTDSDSEPPPSQPAGIDDSHELPSTRSPTSSTPDKDAYRHMDAFCGLPPPTKHIHARTDIEDSPSPCMPIAARSHLMTAHVACAPLFPP
eukprot:362867-Chlamydomonas_euryale.AAC.5